LVRSTGQGSSCLRTFRRSTPNVFPPNRFATTLGTPTMTKATPITYSQLRARADSYRNMVQERAKRRFAEAFGYAGAHYSCFHYAHNWQHLPDLTQAQKSACRYVLWLQRESCGLLQG
jgi:hypothetical protein